MSPEEKATSTSNCSGKLESPISLDIRAAIGHHEEISKKSIKQIHGEKGPARENNPLTVNNPILILSVKYLHK